MGRHPFNYQAKGTTNLIKIDQNIEVIKQPGELMGPFLI